MTAKEGISMKAYFGKKRYKQIHSATHGAVTVHAQPKEQFKKRDRLARPQMRKTMMAG